MRLHHCPSSASSLQQQQQQQQQQQHHFQQHLFSQSKLTLAAKNASFISCTNSTGSSAEASAKLSQLRLEQLNNELERRLHQYEYLVAQEKAILGAYNLNLFTNEGVNNFQRFEVHQKKLQSSQSWSNFQSRKF